MVHVSVSDEEQGQECGDESSEEEDSEVDDMFAELVGAAPPAPRESIQTNGNDKRNQVGEQKKGGPQSEPQSKAKTTASASASVKKSALPATGIVSDLDQLWAEIEDESETSDRESNVVTASANGSSSQATAAVGMRSAPSEPAAVTPTSEPERGIDRSSSSTASSEHVIHETVDFAGDKIV